MVVLDDTGSMKANLSGGRTRMVALKEAAKHHAALLGISCFMAGTAISWSAAARLPCIRARIHARAGGWGVRRAGAACCRTPCAAAACAPSSDSRDRPSVTALLLPAPVVTCYDHCTVKPG